MESIVNIETTREVGKSTLRGMSVPLALPKRCSFSCKYLIFQLNEDTFSNVHIKFYKMVDDYSLLVIVCHIQSNPLCRKANIYHLVGSSDDDSVIKVKNKHLGWWVQMIWQCLAFGVKATVTSPPLK